MPSTNTPNMNLILPTVGQDPGPLWAIHLNANSSTLDGHDHSTGNGVKITPAGMNITSDLAINGNNLNTIRSVKFTAQGSPLSLGSDLGCLYVSGVDLYYNDESGSQVRITQSGGVAGSPGSITTMTPPASVVYTSTNQTFSFLSNTNTPANLSIGSLSIAQVTNSPHVITISSPNSLAANYGITLPTALPASVKLMTLSNAGTIATPFYIDNATIQISGGNLFVNGPSLTNVSGLASNINIPGSNVAINGKSAVSASSALGVNVRIAFATVAADGSFEDGGNSGIQYIAHSVGTGLYYIQFSPVFSSYPAVTATACVESGGDYVTTTEDIEHDHVYVRIANLAGAASDKEFSIIAIGT